MFFPNGDKFEGVFKNGRPNGFGIKTYANGKVIEGTWKDGAPVDVN